VVDERVGRGDVLADGAARADEPDALAVVGDGGPVEVVPVPGRPAVAERPLALGPARGEDAAADREAAGVRRHHVVKRAVSLGRLHGSVALRGRGCASHASRLDERT